MDKDTGRWAHINMRLLHLVDLVISCTCALFNSEDWKIPRNQTRVWVKCKCYWVGSRPKVSYKIRLMHDELEGRENTLVAWKRRVNGIFACSILMWVVIRDWSLFITWVGRSQKTFYWNFLQDHLRIASLFIMVNGSSKVLSIRLTFGSWKFVILH